MKLSIGLMVALATTLPQSLSFQNPVTFQTPCELASKWEIEKSGTRSLLTEPQLEELRTKQVLFVEGFANELTRQIPEERAVLEALKHDLKINASIYYPASRLSVPKNSEHLYHKILDTYLKISKPVIVIGYSKGGVEALTTVLNHPEIIFENIVDSVNILQAPIYGTPMIESENQFNCFKISGLEMFFHEGLHSMTPKTAHEHLTKSLAHLDTLLETQFGSLGIGALNEKKQEISNKIRYIRSYQVPEELNSKLKMIQDLLGAQLDRIGANDGIVLTADQKSDAIGIDLGVLQADHFDLTGKFPKTNPKYSDSKAFIRALLHQICESSSMQAD